MIIKIILFLKNIFSRGIKIKKGVLIWPVYVFRIIKNHVHHDSWRQAKGLPEEYPINGENPEDDFINYNNQKAKLILDNYASFFNEDTVLLSWQSILARYHIMHVLNDIVKENGSVLLTSNQIIRFLKMCDLMRLQSEFLTEKLENSDPDDKGTRNFYEREIEKWDLFVFKKFDQIKNNPISKKEVQLSYLIENFDLYDGGIFAFSTVPSNGRNNGELQSFIIRDYGFKNQALEGYNSIPFLEKEFVDETFMAEIAPEGLLNFNFIVHLSEDISSNLIETTYLLDEAGTLSCTQSQYPYTICNERMETLIDLSKIDKFDVSEEGFILTDEEIYDLSGFKNLSLQNEVPPSILHTYFQNYIATMFQKGLAVPGILNYSLQTFVIILSVSSPVVIATILKNKVGLSLEESRALLSSVNYEHINLGETNIQTFIQSVCDAYVNLVPTQKDISIPLVDRSTNTAPFEEVVMQDNHYKYATSAFILTVAITATTVYLYFTNS